MCVRVSSQLKNSNNYHNDEIMIIITVIAKGIIFFYFQVISDRDDHSNDGDKDNDDN